jgi:hypothetical protein
MSIKEIPAYCKSSECSAQYLHFRTDLFFSLFTAVYTAWEQFEELFRNDTFPDLHTAVPNAISDWLMILQL